MSPQDDAKVLVVDDEPTIRALLRCLLEQRGYGVLEAGSGEEGLELFQQHSTSIGLLITDVVMPGMKGPELASQLLELRPDLPVLYISGYCDEYKDSMRGFLCLSKPFAAEALVRMAEETYRAPQVGVQVHGRGSD